MTEPVTAAVRAEQMRQASPGFIPRNHRVEAALNAAMAGDMAPFETLVGVLARPFDEQPEHAHFMEPPAPGEEVAATFCGT